MLDRITRVGVLTGALAFATVALARDAPAQATPGTLANFALPTTAGVTRSIAVYRGRVVVIFYEDRGSTAQNEPLKQAIGRAHLADPHATEQRYALIPVANVGGFNFWPAEYFAREAISTVARSQGVEIWFDWGRTLQRSLGLRDGLSNVLVLDRRGRVRYHRWGAFPAAEIDAFVSRLRALADET